MLERKQGLHRRCWDQRQGVFKALCLADPVLCVFYLVSANLNALIWKNQANHMCFMSSAERAPCLAAMTVTGFTSAQLCPACYWVSHLHTEQALGLALYTEQMDKFIQTQDFHHFLGFSPDLLCQSVCVHCNRPPFLVISWSKTERPTPGIQVTLRATSSLHLLRQDTEHGEEGRCPSLLAPDMACVQE